MEDQQRPIRRIGILTHSRSQFAYQLSQNVTEWLQARDVDIWHADGYTDSAEPAALGHSDLLIALGGDGTILRAVHLARAGAGTPVLGVALGRLSFLAELEAGDVYTGLAALIDGAGWYDERSLVEATVYASKVSQHLIALNEVVLAHGELNRTLAIEVRIGQTRLTTYHADGVIVATPTGSTAYALSAGGPIIEPQAPVLAVVPIAARLTNLSALVLHEDAVVTLQLCSPYAAICSADGRSHMTLQQGDRVEVRRSQHVCTFARIYPSTTFHARLVHRLRRDPI